MTRMTSVLRIPAAIVEGSICYLMDPWDLANQLYNAP